MFTITTCFGISVTIYLLLNNLHKLNTIYIWLIDKQIPKQWVYFISTNKWTILTTVGIMILLYEFFEDKFTNKIITDLQDEELKNILTAHKDLFLDFCILSDILCTNINEFFNTPKDSGIIYFIHRDITERFPDFEYDIKQHSFKKNNPEHTNIPDFTDEKIYGYHDIDDILDKMKTRINEFQKTNPLYATYAINKYIRGLQGFDISSVIQRIDSQHLLCEKFFKVLSENNTVDIINIMENNNFDDNIKIQQLNKLLRSRNRSAINAALKTIELTIDIETYLHKLRKVFTLKTRRKQLSLEHLIDKCK